MQKASLFLLLPAFYFSSCQSKEELKPLPATEHSAGIIIQDYKLGHIEKSIVCKDGSILACGRSQAGEPMLVSLSANMGVVFWSKVYDAATVGEFSDIAQSPDGNFLTCGTKRTERGDLDVKMTFFSKAGDISFDTTFGGPTDEINARMIPFSSDGTTMVVAAQHNTTYDIVEIFVSGRRISTETLPMSGEQIPYHIIQTTTGPIITGTDNESIVSPGKMFLLRPPTYTFPTGGQVSGQMNGGHTIARHTTQLPGGELLTCGSVAHNGKVSGFICKSNSGFQKMWNTEFAGDANLILSSVIADGKDGFLATGHVYSDAGHSSRCIVIATDLNGKERWRKIYDAPAGSADEPVALFASSIGGYTMLCNNSNNTEAATGDRYYMMHIDSNGELVKH
jgi:hypothetical protein